MDEQKDAVANMKGAWDNALLADGGKHRAAVEHLHGTLAKRKTAASRKNAAIDAMCKQLQCMKTDGSTLADVFEAVAHVLAQRPALEAAIEHGAPGA